MRIRTEPQLIAEYHESIDARLATAMARTKGVLAFHELRAGSAIRSRSDRICWILRAQVGTLEKIGSLLPRDRDPSSVELLACARNLFENLVWLKLFLRDPAWGHFFYGQLLKNQEDDLTGMIAKLEAEATLFLALDEDDSMITETVYHDLGEIDEPSAEYLNERRDEFNRRREEIDRSARRTFALYAAAATFNGYSYQAHLLRTKQIPHWQEQLDLIGSRTAEFVLEVADQTASKRYLGKWNWRGEAERVGMVHQYEFLYRLTSRLLHATPMNIVTEKKLLEGERLTLLEYMVVTTEDIFDAVESFDFPGRVDAIFVEVRGDPEHPSEE